MASVAFTQDTDFNDAASAAIEGWAQRRLSQAAGYRWVSRSPTDWGFEGFRWTREISEIVRDFERLVGFTIPFSPAEKRKTAGFTMLKTHYIMVRKAETQSGQTVLKALLSA